MTNYDNPLEHNWFRCTECKCEVRDTHLSSKVFAATKCGDVISGHSPDGQAANPCNLRMMSRSELLRSFAENEEIMAGRPRTQPK
jgi:hypothetical protein